MASLPPFADPKDGISAEDISAASELIRNNLRWHLWPSMSTTLVLDGTGNDVLSLPTLNLTAVTSVVETQRGAGQSPVTLTVATDIDWSAAGLLWRVDGRCWTSKPRGVTVTFTHGLDDVPADVAQLTLTLAQRSAANPRRLMQQTVGSRSEMYAAGSGGLLADEMALLDRFRRVR